MVSMHMTRAEAKALGLDVPAPKRAKRLEQTIKHDEGTELERTFATAWTRFAPKSLPAPVREYQFNPERDWKTDFYWTLGVAVECEGFDHRQKVTYLKDIRKYNSYAAFKILLFRCTTELLIEDPQAFVLLVAKALREKQNIADTLAREINGTDTW